MTQGDSKRGDGAAAKRRFPPRTATEEEEARVRAADARLAKAPDDADAVVGAALAREDLWRYEEAIALYTRGATIAPEDYRMYLGRAHRLLRVRRLQEARDDLERALERDPYGFNTAYLRGLTAYLAGEFANAASEYERLWSLSQETELVELHRRGQLPGDPRSAVAITSDAPSRIALTSWHVRALMRTARHDEAEALLSTVEDGLTLTAPPAEAYPGTIIRPDSNEHYYAILLYYRDQLREADLLERDKSDGQWTTLAYGVAVRHLAEGRTERAESLLREIVAAPEWARIGHVAAEADLTRNPTRDELQTSS